MGDAPGGQGLDLDAPGEERLSRVWSPLRPSIAQHQRWQPGPHQGTEGRRRRALASLEAAEAASRQRARPGRHQPRAHRAHEQGGGSLISSTKMNG